METLGGKPMPMVGFGFGDVVIGLLLEERGLLPQKTARADDVVFPMSAAEFTIANRVAAHLRSQGRRVLVDYSGRRFKHIIKVAEEVGAEKFYILGGNEVEQGIVKCRDMASREESEVALSSFACK